MSLNTDCYTFMW